MQNIKLVWSRHRIPLVQVGRCLSQSPTYSKYFFYVHMYIHRDEILVHKHVFQKLLNHMHSSSAKRFRIVTFSTFSWTCIHLFNNNCTIKKNHLFYLPWKLGIGQLYHFMLVSNFLRGVCHDQGVLHCV